MATFADAVAITYVVSPAFEFGRVHFESRFARAKRQLVLVLVLVLVDHAASVEGLASVSHHGVDPAAGHQLFQMGLDRRERNRGPVAQSEDV